MPCRDLATDSGAVFLRWWVQWGVKLAPQLYELFPWLKIVVILREPISRTISYTRMHTREPHLVQ
jgi:hypothetical protein